METIKWEESVINIQDMACVYVCACFPPILHLDQVNHVWCKPGGRSVVFLGINCQRG